ncbi:2'-5' RNA ligase family protein [Nakamurella sp. GG22]
MLSDVRVHSVELTVDERTDRLVRDQWNLLAHAGLPSQARHKGASNRPHITMALTATMTPDVAAALGSTFAGLPIPVTVGGLVVFGGRRFVLARLAVPSIELLRLQRSAMGALIDPVDPHETFGPGAWTPHITLARRLTAQQLADALTELGEVRPIRGALVRARRWDMSAKQEQWIESPEPVEPPS